MSTYSLPRFWSSDLMYIPICIYHAAAMRVYIFIYHCYCLELSMYIYAMIPAIVFPYIVDVPFSITCISLNSLTWCHSIRIYIEVYICTSRSVFCNIPVPIPTYVLWAYGLTIAFAIWVYWLSLILPYELIVLLLFRHTYIYLLQFCYHHYQFDSQSHICSLQWPPYESYAFFC